MRVDLCSMYRAQEPKRDYTEKESCKRRERIVAYVVDTWWPQAKGRKYATCEMSTYTCEGATKQKVGITHMKCPKEKVGMIHVSAEKKIYVSILRMQMKVPQRKR